MKLKAFCCSLILLASWFAVLQVEAANRFKQLASDLFVWTDTCNVYVVRDAQSALLIDLGDGSVLGALSQIAVTNVEWILFTHHHREQCQGVERVGPHTRLAAPASERELFEKPQTFRKMSVTLGDAYTVYGSSYVRPPVQPVRLNETLRPNQKFVWRTHEFLCLETPGNSPGSMSYLLRRGDHWEGFSGDVMLKGAKLHTWFDSEWDYGFGAGIRALQKSVSLLKTHGPLSLYPAHGAPIKDADAELAVFEKKLRNFEKLYLRGYDVEAGSVAYQDKVSKPTLVSNVVQTLPHLFKFKKKNFWPNFGLILSASGHGLVVDCGLLDQKFLEESLEGMGQHYGLKAIDAVIVTHMHGDHFLEGPFLREKWGAKLWALDNMAEVCEHPERFDYAAPIQAYGKPGVTGVRFDRLFKPGEVFQWEEYQFKVDWMPGQTEFALCLHGKIDGRHVAFTGDNLFGDPDNPLQSGHEAMVAHNSAVLEEGYIYAAEYLTRLKPDLLVGGHSFVMDHPAGLIERYRAWSYQMRSAFEGLLVGGPYQYRFDPFWVRAYPYRSSVRPGATIELALNVRSFRSSKQVCNIRVHSSPPLRVDPGTIDLKLAGQRRTTIPLRVQAADDAEPGVYLIAFDVTLDGERLGEWFDCIVEVAK